MGPVPSAWKSSSRCGAVGDCIEVKLDLDHDSVSVRDSTDRNGPELRFSASAWADFTSDIKAGIVSR